MIPPTAGNSSPGPVGGRDGGAEGASRERSAAVPEIPTSTLVDVQALAVPVEWMRYCPVCDAERAFYADHRNFYGLVGRCTRCGDARVLRVTREESEAA